MSERADPRRLLERHTGLIVLITAVAALAGFLFGYDTAIINGAVTAVQDHFHVGPVTLGLSVSGALLGAAAGALGAGRLADRFGRIPLMVAAAVLFLVQSFGVSLSFTIIDFGLWRIVGGIAVGAASVIAPAYIAESAPADLRGRLGSFQQLAIVVGIFAALLVDFAIAAAAGGAAKPWLLGLQAWRWMFLSEAIPALVYLVGALRIPESPRYLVAIHKVDHARSVLARIVGSARADAKIGEIQQTLSTAHKPEFRDLRSQYGLLPIVWIGIGVSILQQFVGINVIFYYSSVLWRAVGFTEQQSLEIGVITGVVNIVTTLIAIATIDWFGRKPLLLIGSLGMVATLGIMAYLFGTAPLVGGQPVLHGANGTIALFAANIYVFFFGMSWGPVVWVLLGEMFPNRVRAVALGLAAGAQWVANFVVSATFPSLKNLGLGYAYGLYAVAAAIAFIFVLTLVHETKGKELETMTDDMRQAGAGPQVAS
ncbi:MAG: sugar porter family MFS transporter [bacterium]|jgi:sugar porter (SP) family MFS transporter|nr:sugar porter family MFS transporter [bacterium]